MQILIAFAVLVEATGDVKARRFALFALLAPLWASIDIAVDLSVAEASQAAEYIFMFQFAAAMWTFHFIPCVVSIQKCQFAPWHQVSQHI